MMFTNYYCILGIQDGSTHFRHRVLFIANLRLHGVLSASFIYNGNVNFKFIFWCNICCMISRTVIQFPWQNFLRCAKRVQLPQYFDCKIGRTRHSIVKWCVSGSYTSVDFCEMVCFWQLYQCWLLWNDVFLAVIPVLTFVKWCVSGSYTSVDFCEMCFWQLFPCWLLWNDVFLAVIPVLTFVQWCVSGSYTRVDFCEMMFLAVIPVLTFCNNIFLAVIPVLTFMKWCVSDS